MKLHVLSPSPLLALFAFVVTSRALHAAPQFSLPLPLPGDTALSPAAGDQYNVAVARGTASSLMVWEDGRAALSGTVSTGGYGTYPFDVYAARLDDAGDLIDTTPIVVSQASFNQSSPKVAWNGQAWLVVWSSRRPTQYSTTAGIYAARVSAAGQLLDDPPLLISDPDDTEELFPVVASDGADWAVIWAGGLSSGESGVIGCVVTALGAVGPPTTLFSTVGGVGFYIPTNFELAFAQGRYLMVSEHYQPGGNGSWDILGQFLDPALNKIGGEFAIGSNGLDETRASVASNGSSFCAVWQHDVGGYWTTVVGTPVLADGTVVVPGGADLSGTIYPGYPYPSVAWNGASWTAAFDDYTAVYATRLSAAGSVVGGPFQVSQGSSDTQRPACFPLPGGAGVVWSDDRNFTSPWGPDRQDLYAAFVSSSGSASSDHCVSLSVPAQTHPDIAGSAASGYLAAFLSETASDSRILVQRVSAAGAPIDAQPIELATGPGTLRNPAVAWNGSLWLVAWEEWLGNFPPNLGRILGRRVLPNGTPLDATPLQVMPGNTPDVASVGDVFLVVSSHEPTNHVRYIQSMRVRGSDGALLDASPPIVGSSYSVAPAVAAFSDRWLVTWQRHSTHDNPYSSVMGNLVLSNGVPQSAFGAGSVSLRDRTPALAADAQQALLVWHDGSDVRGRRMLADGTGLDPLAGFQISSAPNSQFAPSVAWNGAEFFAAWNDYRAHVLLDAGVGDVFGSRVDAAGAVLDPAGLPIADDSSLPEGDPAVVGDLGRNLALYTAVHDEAPFGTWRVTLRSTLSASVTYCTAGTTTNGCNATMSASGIPSVAATSGFVLTASGVEGQKQGLIFYGVSGRNAAPWSPGSSSFLCVTPPIQRTGTASSGGSADACDGSLSINFLDYAASYPGALGQPFAAGDTVWSQAWFRDPPAPRTTNLSDGLEFTLAP